MDGWLSQHKDKKTCVEKHRGKRAMPSLRAFSIRMMRGRLSECKPGKVGRPCVLFAVACPQ